TWIIAGHQPMIDRKTQDEIDWLEETILNYRDTKPVQSEIEKSASERGISKQKLKIYLSFLFGNRKIRIFNNDYMHARIIETNKIRLLRYLSDNPTGINIQEYKSAIGGTKPFRALLGEIFESDKIIQFVHGSDMDTRILLTQHGKDILKKSG
ncbi:MAG: hypothetical protein ACNA7V_09715, partial [Bacteroidales bacterium]